MEIRTGKINDLATSEIVSNVEKFQAVVTFHDGTIIKSDWFYSDIHAKQFAMQFFDDENYAHYQVDYKVAKEDLSKIPQSPRHPVFG